MTDQNNLPLPSTPAPPAPPVNALDETRGADPNSPGQALARQDAAPSASTSATVKMLNPSGETGDVPSERVPAAISAGYQAVVQMTNPNGEAGYVPLAKSHDALAAGYKFGSPISDNTTIGPPKSLSARKVFSTVADIPLDPLGSISKGLDALTSQIENYNEPGRAEHPVLAHVGELTRAAKELLSGGQEAGEPLGTRSGILNNPVSTAISLAPGAAELGDLATTRLANAVRGSKAAEAAKVSEINPESFIYREKTPVPQHGTPVEVASPLDNPTINRLPGGKDLSPEAVKTLKEHIGGEPGKEIEAGSSAKNTLFKAVEPVQKTLRDTGLEMNRVINDAAAFKTSVAEDGKLDPVIDAVRDGLPGADEEKLNATIDKELQSANDVLQSTDPAEVLAYRRKLGNQIDWNDVPRNPQSPGEVQNVARVKIYKTLGEKIHTEIPKTVELDKVFQPNLELQSQLDAKLGTAVSRDAIEANAQHLSELNKGKAQLENEAHNEIVRKNRELAGLDTSDVEGTVGVGAKPEGDIAAAIDKAVTKFKNLPPSETEALKTMLQPSVKAGKVFGAKPSYYDALRSFDKLTPQEQAARFSDPAAVRQVLRSEARNQVGAFVIKGLGVVGVAHLLGVDKAVIKTMLQ